MQTICMFTARVLLFTLHESPRYLVRAGRQQDAVNALQMISHYNGDATPIGLADVHDHTSATPESAPFLPTKNDDDDDEEPGAPVRPVRPPRMASSTGLFDGPEVKGYESATHTPTDSPNSPPLASTSVPSVSSPDDQDVPAARPRPPKRRSSHRMSMLTSRSSYRGESRASQFVPKIVRGPVDAWLDKVSLVLSPEWRRTTILVWITWWAMSFGELFVLLGWFHVETLPAYTMFNVYLPKLLETAGGAAEQKSITESLWDIVIFTLGGCPGALVRGLMRWVEHEC
jgi:hypothetical protein